MMTLMGIDRLQDLEVSKVEMMAPAILDQIVATMLLVEVLGMQSSWIRLWASGAVSGSPKMSQGENSYWNRHVAAFGSSPLVAY